MARSGKSRSKKTDKETQSPMLKIFKDIMQRENNDPEKRNLLKEHNEDKKKKQYSESKTKSDQMTIDSSGTERCKKPVPYRTHEQRNLEYEQDKKQSTSLHSDKKESWWLWGDNEKVEREESCSCVSCALKKLIGSEFMCVGCLLTIFTISVVVAFLLVFKSVPTVKTDETALPIYGTNSDSERLKRKIGLMRERREFDSDSPMRDKKPWDDTISRSLDGLSGISGDFGLPGFRDLNNLEFGSRSSELSNVLGGTNMFELQNSDRLRDFYRKLIQTDAQIKMLKKGGTDFTLFKTDDEKLKSILDRAKRSFKVHKQPNIRISNVRISRPKRNGIKRSLKFEKDKIGAINNEEFENNYRENTNDVSVEEQNKFNDTPMETQENNGLLKQYKADERKKVPKCSHAPKEAKSHEKQLKHPFYKNTQRLDELLDRFMEKGLPKILTDSFGKDVIFENKCKHPNLDGVKVTGKDVDKPKSKYQTSSEENKDIYELTTEPRIKKNSKDSLSETDDVIFSMSTLLSPDFKSLGDMALNRNVGRGFNYRKLMQADEVDEENLGYEDLKEVLTDDFEGHDDTDNRGERTKRNEDSKDQLLSIYNQNWKGPIPLYPDEINSMIKNAALSANNPRALKRYEAETRLSIKDESPEVQKTKHNVGDVQYIEDYLINKYDKLAQAYSDYGVLDGKKESVKNEKEVVIKAGDHRVKLSLDKGRFKGGFLDRLKKGSQTSEDVKFEAKSPGSVQGHREDDPSQIYKYIQKHVKISHAYNSKSPSLQSPTTWPLNKELELTYTPKKYNEIKTSDKLEAINKNYDSDNEQVFAMNKGQRSLKSIDVDSNLNEDVQTETNKFDYQDNINTERAEKYNHSILELEHRLLRREIKDNTIRSNISHNETNVVPNFNENTTAIEGNIEKRFMNNYGLEENLLKNQTDKVNNGQSLSDFFMLLANFFSFLDGVDVNDKRTNSSSNTTINNKTVTDNATSKHTTEIFYPVYDSEVIENIGHRSRVLLSVEENNTTDLKLITTEEADLKRENADGITSIESTKTPNSTIGNYIATPINTTKYSTKKMHTDSKVNNVSVPKTKNMVKRNIDDTNLIFWNDMYDEEYGVDVDHLENNVRDKHSAKVNNIVKSSGEWLKDKVRILTDSIRKKTVKEGNNIKQTISEGTSKSRLSSAPNIIPKKMDKRDLNDVDGGKIDFAALTANMKEVCRKAAKAVEHTRNLEVREESKESAVASSLMQQLARLMTDLVDFQVQQKTCLKLPPDLQNFLEWLTGSDKSEDTKRSFDDIDNILPLEDIVNYDKSTENYLELLTTVTEKDIQTSRRSDYLETFHAVQDLLQQYERMSEEDKSKMIGIKEYLENQLRYLQKRLSSGDYYNSYHKTEFPLRFRRSLFKTVSKPKCNHRLRRNLGKFIKNSGKKHTTTTMSVNENSSFHDINKSLKLRSNTVKIKTVTIRKKKGNVNEGKFHGTYSRR